MKYAKKFYSDQRDGSLRSAREVVPLILDMLQPQSVVDVGCGVGTWLSVFLDHGVQDVLGLDGSHVPLDMLMIPRKAFQSADLAQPAPIGRLFDLALSVEVAEHLPMDAAEAYVSFLTSLAPVVVFGAAIPFQGGTEHVNEQWPDFWAGLFKKRGYAVADAIRPRIWNNENVEPFYRQDLLIFVNEGLMGKYPAIEQARKLTREEMLSVVHPRVFVGRNSYPLASPLHLMAWAMRLACSKAKGFFRSLTCVQGPSTRPPR
jgi:SAM-dependent methyltransferase